MINTLIDEFRREKNWREHTVLCETLENEKHEQACETTTRPTNALTCNN
jgi:hypothetical protein